MSDKVVVPDEEQRKTLCMTIHLDAGANGEPLACALERGHEGEHSWQSLIGLDEYPNSGW